ncbi:hypothetical protein PK28_00175 [Hymenobacter sp. DG25B]|jgi:hypothetical protein|uniref:hypothetical protein n=1 Tax=Hymenobacter sp. DG25B TaxID=1385664 RepID=UPI00054093B7|nr:hypothetical protein [Hymenobacter sp. DG25B]AIZ62503.1 hypothetical protein PK28_00175 [Hymenobacter sp. DG25B]
MSAARFLLLLAVCAPLVFSNCARRNKAETPAKTTAVAEPARPAAPIARTAARDLASVMGEELQLSNEQQAQVRVLLKSTVQQVNAAREQYPNDRTALTTELKRINAESENQLKQLFTPEQFKQYQLKKRDIQAKMQARKAGGEK